MPIHEPLLDEMMPDDNCSGISPPSSSDAVIRFFCTNCLAKLKVDSRKAGAIIRCPKCTVPVEVPLPNDPHLQEQAPMAQMTMPSHGRYAFINNPDGDDRPGRQGREWYSPERRSSSLLPWLLSGCLFLALVSVVLIVLATLVIHKSSSNVTVHAIGTTVTKPLDVDQHIFRVKQLKAEIEEYDEHAQTCKSRGDYKGYRKDVELTLVRVNELIKELQYLINASPPHSDERDSWSKLLVIQEREAATRRELIDKLIELGH
jgi:hypothetical protein